MAAHPTSPSSWLKQIRLAVEQIFRRPNQLAGYLSLLEAQLGRGHATDALLTSKFWLLLSSRRCSVLATAGGGDDEAARFALLSEQAQQRAPDLIFKQEEFEANPQGAVLQLLVESNKHPLRTRLTIFQNILRMLPGERHALLQCAAIMKQADRHAEALLYLLVAYVQVRQQLAQPLQLPDASPASSFLLHQSCTTTEELTLIVDAAECFAQARLYPMALDVYLALRISSAADAAAPVVRLLDQKIAGVLLEQGRLDEADALLQALLPKDDEAKPIQSDEQTLVLACKASALKGRTADAVGLALSLIAAAPDSQAVRRLFGDVLTAGGAAAAELVVRGVSDPANAGATAQLFGFLSTLARDQGHIDAAVRFGQVAADARPDSVAYLLSWVHLEEIRFDYARCLDLIERFCRHCPLLAVGFASCQLVQQALAAARPSPSRLAELTAIVDAALTTAPPPTASPYSADELELLALFFTAAKILYLTGRLAAAAQLCRLLHPLRDGRQLHLSPVRNEHAYFSCVHQIVDELRGRDALVDNAASTADGLVYAIGDSHVLPTAWHRLPDGRVLRPLLTTGCKIWHLRKQSTFFPKRNFDNAVALLPDGATVLAVLGEIDCREGFPASVERCRYETIEEGCAVSVAVYVDTLLELIRRKRLRVFVHPVSPALDPTRHIVQPFNSLLRDAVVRANDPALRWLDFVQRLLADDGAKLLDAYYLDGTHLSTRYMQLLDAAWQQATVG